MIHFVRENMAPLMFGGMVLFMLIGYPAAFSLAATGLFFGFIGIELGLISPDFLGNLTYQLFGIVSNDLLLAIPFFTFMGAILERCGLAEDLLDSIGQLFGPARGGLSYAVIFVGAILGAITGTVTGQGGGPVKGECVTAVPFRTPADPFTGLTTPEIAITSRSGSYALLGLPPGSYKIEFSAGCGGSGFATQWWRGVSSAGSANPVTLRNSVISGVDATLRR